MDFKTVLAWTLIGVLIAFGDKRDVFLVLSFRLCRDWNTLRELWILHGNTSYVTYGFGMILSTFIVIQLLRYMINLSSNDTIITKDGFPVGPLLFPCRTDHSRMVPKKHSFSYSYFLVGVPIDWTGNSGGLISYGLPKAPKAWYMNILDTMSFGIGGTGAWWTINADDYLGRGVDKDGLRGKLRSFLKTQGVDPDQYAHAYLLTAARFLGYASNPVSIWHLYSADLELKALVLEVNNTFDERHNYFLEPAVKSPSSSTSRYTGTWPKDFYVSVFNSRTGAYSLSAIDPLAAVLRPSEETDTISSIKGKAFIDSTITLSLPQPSTKPMLIARVYSSSPPMDPSTMTIFQKTRFLLTWSWVGFATFPRTVQQAWIILFRVKMPWVFTPQPRADTMPAKASPAQSIIAKQFKDFLRHIVQKCTCPIQVKYIPAGLISDDAKEEIMATNHIANFDFTLRELEVRVLTPLFYSRIIQYDSIHNGLLKERQSGTIAFSDPYELQNLNFTCSLPGSDNTYSNLLFSLISYLKRDPAYITPLADEAGIHVKSEMGDDIKSYRQYLGMPHRAEWAGGGASHPGEWKSQLRLSGMDAFVLASTSSSTETQDERNIYARTALKFLLANRLGMGSMELLDLEIFVLKVLVAWILVKLSA